MSLASKHLTPRTALIVALAFDTVALHSVTVGQRNLGAPIAVRPKEFLRVLEESAEIENNAKGVTLRELAAFEGGVMFGWDTPAADPRSYDEQGHAIAFQRQLKAA